MSNRALIESGTAPDLEVAGLRIWVHGRESPGSSDFWDGNWLRATARCSGSGASVSVAGSFLRSDELLRWLSEIELLQQSLTGEARLAAIEPELGVLLRAPDPGRLEVRVDITPDQLSQEHVFRFELDPSSLPALALALRRLLERYPVTGGAP